MVLTKYIQWYSISMVVLSMDDTQIYPASCPYISEIQLSLRTYFTILRTNYLSHRALGLIWPVEVQVVFIEECAVQFLWGREE